MNKKIEKVVLKLENNFKDFETLKDVFETVKKLNSEQSDYFSFLGPQNVILLTFLMFSYKKTNGFELGYQMLNDSMFLSFIFSEGNNHREMCEQCAGDGQVECNTCDGTGDVPCEECDATGETPCDTCDGSGFDPENEEESCWDCNGAGNKTCWNCHGFTTDTCFECHGTRLEPCQNCDEIGEIETEDWDYEMETILTWDKSLISKSIEFENTLVPIMSMEEYNNNNNYIVITYYGDDNYLEFKKGFKPNMVYCFGHNDNPDIKLSSRGMIVAGPFKNLSNFGY